MTSKLRIVLCVLCAVVCTSEAAGKTRPRVAVLKVEAIQGIAPGTASILTNLVAARVAELGRFEVLSSSDVAAMIGFEKQKMLLGCTDSSSCLAEIGGALGVDYLLTGQVGKVGSRYSLTLVLADVRKARVISRQSQLCEASDDRLVDVAQPAVDSLFKPLMTTADGPIPVVTSAPATPSRVPAYVMLGATVAIAAGGVTSGVIAKKRYGDLETQLQGQHGASYQATWDAGQKGIKDAALAADILYGTAAVAAGITVWLFVRSVPPSSPTVSLAAGSHGAAVSLSGSF